MSQQIDLKTALAKIQELETANKKLKDEIIELKAEKIEIEKNWEDEGEQSGNIIYELKNEVKELKKRMDNLEKNIEDDTVYPEAETEDEAAWYDLKVDHDYEIRNIFPYDIRKKSNGKIVKESVCKNSGYVRVTINGKSYQKHILVAKHFIPNPDPKNKKIVDHKDHDRTNYHTSNLRWVSVSDNNKNIYGRNGQKYNYLDSLPNNCQPITLFNGWEFNSYYISSDNKIWFYNGNQYRELTVYKNRNYAFVNMIDITNKHHTIGLNALVQEFNPSD